MKNGLGLKFMLTNLVIVAEFFSSLIDYKL